MIFDAKFQLPTQMSRKLLSRAAVQRFVATATVLTSPPTLSLSSTNDASSTNDTKCRALTQVVRPGFIYTDIHASGGEPGRE